MRQLVSELTQADQNQQENYKREVEEGYKGKGRFLTYLVVEVAAKFAVKNHSKA